MDGILVLAPKKHGYLFAVLAGCWIALGGGGNSVAFADQIDLSLNLNYDNNADPLSGGTWELAAKTDVFGLAGLVATLQGVDSSGITSLAPNGIVNGSDFAGLDLLTSAQSGFVELVFFHRPPTQAGDQNRFYGIGSIVDPDGATPNYPGKPADAGFVGPEITTLTNLQNGLWGTGDFLGDSTWAHAAILASGTFAAGQTPSFYADSSKVSEGSVFTSVPAMATQLGTISGIIEATTVVRSDLGTAVEGDYNGDGVVGLADYSLWRDTLGAAAVPMGSGADGNSNGVIDAADYDIWKINFGSTGAAITAPAIAGTAVPEPQGVMLAVVASSIVGLLGRVKSPALKARFLTSHEFQEKSLISRETA